MPPVPPAHMSMSIIFLDIRMAAYKHIMSFDNLVIRTSRAVELEKKKGAFRQPGGKTSCYQEKVKKTN